MWKRMVNQASTLAVVSNQVVFLSQSLAKAGLPALTLLVCDTRFHFQSHALTPKPDASAIFWLPTVVTSLL